MALEQILTLGRVQPLPYRADTGEVCVLFFCWENKKGSGKTFSDGSAFTVARRVEFVSRLKKRDYGVWGKFTKTGERCPQLSLAFIRRSFYVQAVPRKRNGNPSNELPYRDAGVSPLTHLMAFYANVKIHFQPDNKSQTKRVSTGHSPNYQNRPSTTHEQKPSRAY